uniref:Uncharacterized protein n=1 Tax=Anopheles atroparvus TaxID=41427 RepID=A0A182JF53_ANOAO
MQNVQSNQSQHHLPVGQHPLNVSQAPVASHNSAKLFYRPTTMRKLLPISCETEDDQTASASKCWCYRVINWVTSSRLELDWSRERRVHLVDQARFRPVPDGSANVLGAGNGANKETIQLSSIRFQPIAEIAVAQDGVINVAD